MELNKKYYVFTILFLIFVFFSGCSATRNTFGNWNDTTSMEEYGNKIAETRAVLRAYIGKHKDEIRKDFGEPHELDKRASSKAFGYQQEKIKFDEVWEYCYSRGFILTNFERGCKEFFLKDDIVVGVDAF